MWTEEQLKTKLKTGRVRIKSDNGLNIKTPALKRTQLKPVLQKVGNHVVEVTDKPKLYVGIDPDKDKSGVAVWDSVKQDFILLDDLKFFDLIEAVDKLTELQDYEAHEFIFLVEYGKGNKAIFGSEKGKVNRARCTGWNEQVGELICEYLQKQKLTFKKVVPKKNRYSHFGVSKGKIDQQKLNHITGSKYQNKINPFQAIRKSKLNQEIRDALMMVYKLL